MVRFVHSESFRHGFRFSLRVCKYYTPNTARSFQALPWEAERRYRAFGFVFTQTRAMIPAADSNASAAYSGR